jgi:hypothetical protein
VWREEKPVSLDKCTQVSSIKADIGTRIDEEQGSTMDRSIIFKGITALISVVFMVVAYLPAVAGTMINGKEVTAYMGQIVSHNERTGEISVKTGKSRSHWRLSRRVVAYYGKDRVQLAVVWHRSKQVRVHVSSDGEVQRITVLSWK